MQAERGRSPASPSGHELRNFGLVGSVGKSSGSSPGCWIPTNIVFSSGVVNTPVISHCLGPTRKRRTSPVAGSAQTIWLLPKPAYTPLLIVELDTSVSIHSLPLGAT